MMTHQQERNWFAQPVVFESVMRSVLQLAAFLGVAGIVAFAITPACCVLGWLQGYGPGGMSELQNQHRLEEMWGWSAFLSPVHLLAFLLPQRFRSRVIGVAVSAALIFLSYFFWFIAAAAIASV